MSAPSSLQPAAAPVAPKMPGEVVRGLVSLWLIFHLFGVVLGMTTNTEMGNSSLLRGVKQAPPLAQYIYALWLDVGYNYHLTYGSPLDADHSLKVEIVYPDRESEVITLPPKDVDFGERRERHAQLAYRAALAAEMEQGSTVPEAVGKAILDKTQAKEVIFRVRRHRPLSIDDARSSDAAQRDPKHERTYSTVYTANVRLDRRGQPQVSTPQEARDVAPVTNPAESSSAEPSSAEPPSPARPDSRRKQADPLPRAKSDKPPPTLPSFPPSLPFQPPEQRRGEGEKR